MTKAVQNQASSVGRPFFARASSCFCTNSSRGSHFLHEVERIDHRAFAGIQGDERLGQRQRADELIAIRKLRRAQLRAGQALGIRHSGNVTVIHAVAPEPHRRERDFLLHDPAKIRAKRIGLVAVLSAGFRIELRHGVGETLQTLQREGVVAVVPVPIASGHGVIAQHLRRHEAGHEKILPIGNVLHVGIPLADDPIGRRLQSRAVLLEPLLVAGEEISFGHGEQQPARSRRACRRGCSPCRVSWWRPTPRLRCRRNNRRPISRPAASENTHRPDSTYRAGRPDPYRGRRGRPRTPARPTCAGPATDSPSRAIGVRYVRCVVRVQAHLRVALNHAVMNVQTASHRSMPIRLIANVEL